MKLNSSNEIKSSNVLDMLRTLIRFDKVGKPPYSFGLILALEQVRRLNVKAMTVVEFGVFQGNGLRELANAAALLADASGIQIDVLGFDTGAGMPQPVDYRDHPETWDVSDMAMTDPDEILASLPKHPLLNCNLVLGNIAETVRTHLIPRLTAEKPLGFVAVDVDSYTAATHALTCLLGPAEHYLPTVPVYMDDIEYNLAVCSRTGEGLAISEFNLKNEMRFLENKAVRTMYAQKYWHKLMYFCQVFDHRSRQPGAKIDLNINILSF